MHKLSHGHEILEHDVQMIGAKEVLENITNLDGLEDGLYEVITINESKDWETGYIDDYDYKLIPFTQ